jgi:uncharacterized protein (UPF0248 family)
MNLAFASQFFAKRPQPRFVALDVVKAALRIPAILWPVHIPAHRIVKIG